MKKNYEDIFKPRADDLEIECLQSAIEEDLRSVDKEIELMLSHFGLTKDSDLSNFTVIRTHDQADDHYILNGNTVLIMGQVEFKTTRTNEKLQGVLTRSVERRYLDKITQQAITKKLEQKEQEPK